MLFTEKLRQKAGEANSIVCLGMDPVIDKIPLKLDVQKNITKFYADILEATADKIGAAKPNYAFFAQYGFPGLKALKEIISICKKKNVITILDAKRGDTGKSSEAYAKEIFDFWKADAATISPYMGKDSVMPFIKYCGKGKGVYILVRTSNPGANDVQEISSSSNKKIFAIVAEKVSEWKKEGTGAVVGATNTAELSQINELFRGKIPLLIPGAGAQGGSAKEVAEVLKRAGDIKIHRINSSRSINYAYIEQDTDDYAGEAAKAVDQLNREIGKV